MEEVWKSVKSYEGLYEVSNLGRVKSLKRKLVSEDKILKLMFNSTGYLKVSLYKDGKIKVRVIHQLVAESFLNHTVDGFKLVVDHISNVKTDNRLENLQVITTRENLSKDKKGTSKYTGVCWYSRYKNWRSKIVINGKHKHLGYFNTELEASNAYQIALKGL
tara:strand:- start:369 stop:854 length:486 start_codon:yes stop_codon:yes gene_type:complete